MQFQKYHPHRIIQYFKIKKKLKTEFHDELAYFKGKHKTDNANQSVLFFAINRCGSTFAGNVLKRLVQDAGMTRIDTHTYFSRGGKFSIEPGKMFKRFGYLYGPFYSMYKKTIPLPNLDNYKIILLLRDPRDVLTSYYFHCAHEIYDNPARAKFILSRSKQTLNKTIDEWVLQMASGFLDHYKSYCEKLLSRPNVLFVKYEDMVKDFSEWLNTIIKFLDIDVKDETVNSIITQSDFKVDQEDVKSHKRQVFPGDHKRKLKKETIDALNSEFREVLHQLDISE